MNWSLSGMTARGVALALVLCACGDGSSRDAEEEPAASYVGRTGCVRCHEQEDKLWQGSHHDLAMQEVRDETVLGDFSGVTLEHFGLTSTFFRRDGRFFVRTDGPDGELADFEVAYVFGLTPLQQYLVAFPDGRLQTLQLAWDSRPAELGGQRWFHLYPDEPTPAGDELHWTGRRFNWNYSCAECHSTDLRRNYDPATDTYATTFAEIDVSCEACHGPGSRHVQWGELEEQGRAPDDPTLGLTTLLNDRSGGRWVMDPARGISSRTAPPSPDLLLDTCGRCHSRRWQMAEGYDADQPLLDTHVPSLLGETLYFADGQIQDEVYEWGSFIQSRMHAKGVRCTDCHDAHSLRLRGEKNQLCGECHLARAYDTPEHHHHEPGREGSLCVDCHMAPRTYMVVDPRRDHSFRVPRPDLTLELGLPNACNACHTKPEEDAFWAIDRLAEWYPDRGRVAAPHFARALAAARQGAPRAPALLAAVVTDREQPAVVRATALAALSGWPSSETLEILRSASADADGIVRTAALAAMESYPSDLRATLAAPLLVDRLRAVRIEAARLLADVPDERLPAAAVAQRAQAFEELLAVEHFNADTPESHLNLGLLALGRGETEEAEREYRKALVLDPAFVPAAVNLADLLREAGREEDAMQVLTEALRVAPRQATLHHVLGLALVRAGRNEDAIASLGRARELAPESARFAYVYGVALDNAGSRELALQVFERALAVRPHDRDLLTALATVLRDAGRWDEALRHARKLCADWPADPAAAALLRELEANSAGR